MAEKVLHSTDKKANFQRLARLLVCGGITLLREVFDSIHPPANLSAILNKPATKTHLQQLKDHKKVITQQEWKILYPSPGMCGKSTDFDITLLFKLLRNICGLVPPLAGWDNLPTITDNSLEADLVRIKYNRNTVYGHSNDMEISDSEFFNLWREISEALLRIACSISSARKDEWEKAIKKLLTEPLTPDANQSITELKSWYKKDMDTKDEIEKLTNEMKEMKILLDQLNLKQEERDSKQEQMLKQIMEIVVQTEGASGQSTAGQLQTNPSKPPANIDFWYVVYCFKEPIIALFKYLIKKLGVHVQDNKLGSLVITVSCGSLEVLENLWEDYCSGHLNEVVQETLVTKEVLKALCLSEVKFKTTISEEEYKACKEWFMQRSGKHLQVNLNILFKVRGDT